MSTGSSDSCNCGIGGPAGERHHPDCVRYVARTSNTLSIPDAHSDTQRLERICTMISRLVVERGDVGLSPGTLGGLQRVAKAALDASRAERAAPETCDQLVRGWHEAIKSMETSDMDAKLTAQRRVVDFERKLMSWAERSSEKASVQPKPWTMGGNLEGTSRQGLAPFSYSRIVEVFGEPTEVCTEPGARCAFNWTITFADGTIASIYEYKSSSLYGDGDDAPTPEQMKVDFTDWHIGGHRGGKAVELVLNALNGGASHDGT